MTVSGCCRRIFEDDRQLRPVLSKTAICALFGGALASFTTAPSRGCCCSSLVVSGRSESLKKGGVTMETKERRTDSTSGVLCTLVHREVELPAGVEVLLLWLVLILSAGMGLTTVLAGIRLVVALLVGSEQFTWLALSLAGMLILLGPFLLATGLGLALTIRPPKPHGLLALYYDLWSEFVARHLSLFRAVSILVVLWTSIFVLANWVEPIEAWLPNG